MEMLQDDSGNWVVDVGRLKEMAADFYSKLFQSNNTVGGEFLVGHFPKLSE